MAKRQKREHPFRKILTRLMRERNLGIREAARIAGVAPSTIAGWRSGRNPDNFDAVRKLATHFGVGLGFLLNGIHDHEVLSGQRHTIDFVDDGKAVEYHIARVMIQPLAPRRSR